MRNGLIQLTKTEEAIKYKWVNLCTLSEQTTRKCKRHETGNDKNSNSCTETTKN